MKTARVVMILLMLALGNAPALAQSIEQLIQQGNAAQNAKRYSEAELIWRQVIQRDPKNSEAYTNLGIALATQTKLDDAIAAFRKAIDLNPQSAAAYNNLGTALYTQKKLDDAIAAFRKAIDLNPQSAVAYTNLGIALYDQKKLDDAIAAFRKATDLNPQSAVAHTNLGITLYTQKKLDDAIAAFRKAIDLNPQSAVAYTNLGIALYDQKKLDDAIAAFRKATDLNPQSAAAYNNLGVALYDQKKLDDAIAAFRKALSLEDTSDYPTKAHTAAHNGLGLVLQEQGKLEEAIKEFEQAVKLNPTYAFAQSNLKEAQRLLALQGNPQRLALADTSHLPDDPKTPMRRAVVKVVAFFPGNARGTGYGTGCVIQRQGNKALILTNRHVVFEPETRQKGENLQVELYFGNTPPGITPPRLGEKNAGTVRILHMTDPDDPLDLALLEVTGLPADIEPLPFADGVKEDVNALVIGNPGGNWSTDEGKVLDVEDVLTLKIKLESGNSGSPVLVNNQMVGLIFKVFAIDGNNVRGTSYAYPMHRIAQKLSEWGIKLP